jgi:hypothetical protein
MLPLIARFLDNKFMKSSTKLIPWQPRILYFTGESRLHVKPQQSIEEYGFTFIRTGMVYLLFDESKRQEGFS